MQYSEKLALVLFASSTGDPSFWSYKKTSYLLSSMYQIETYYLEEFQDMKIFGS